MRAVDGIVIPDTADAVKRRFHLGLAASGGIDIRRFSIHMLGVFYAPLNAVPLGAPQTADHRNGNSQVFPQLIGDPHQLLPGFCREAVAVSSAALAAEFFPGKIADLLPEAAFPGSFFCLSLKPPKIKPEQKMFRL